MSFERVPQRVAEQRMIVGHDEGERIHRTSLRAKRNLQAAPAV
jgi:hypothetical protein